MPPEDAPIFESLRVALRAPAGGLDAIDLPRMSGDAVVVRSWADLADAYAAGWPVARAELGRALVELSARRSDLPPESIANALTRWGETAVPLSTEPQSVPTGPRDPVDEMASRLGTEASSEARSFGQRLLEAGTRDDPDRARRLVGCLISLDELAEGQGRGWGWLRPVRDRLLEVVRAEGGCEVLDDSLIGQPVRMLADEVIAVGMDDRSPPGSHNRVTKVGRPGYALRLPDGSRQVLAKALVYLGR